jgi:Uma2 family endonuclease
MAGAGILGEDDRVELIQGEILRMTPIGSRHAACVNKLTALFAARFSDRVQVSVQNPVRLDQYSEPQPDLALLLPREDFYAERLPEARDVRLLVEVAQASAGFDRNRKSVLYARAGIPELWIVDLTERRVDAHTDPSRRGYRRIRGYGPAETIEWSGETLPVDEMLV